MNPSRDKQDWRQAFDDLEREAAHPSDSEIAEMLDGVGTEFTRADIRAHVAWCRRCAQVAADYESFGVAAQPGAKAVEDAAWQAIECRLPKTAVPIARPKRWEWPLAAAAGFAACALPGAAWLAMRPAPPQVIVEKRIEVPAPAQPLRVANAAVIDLMPLGARERAGGPADAGVRLPNPLPGVVTLVLNAAATGDEAQARVLDAAGREAWTGTLRRQSGVFTLALDEAALSAAPLTIELMSSNGKVAARYRVGR